VCVVSVGVILILVRTCLLAVGSGATDRGGTYRGGEHGREPASGRSAYIAVHVDNRELHPVQWEEAVLRGFCRWRVQMVSSRSLALFRKQQPSMFLFF
jgi:hypothetical protein